MAYLDSGAIDFILDMMLFAASRFRPTITMCELPSVWRLNASAMPCPIPDVPPTNTATAFVYFAADARLAGAAREAMDFVDDVPDRQLGS
jgi:hypothetical protein